jgi:hypothetical protein
MLDKLVAALAVKLAPIIAEKLAALLPLMVAAVTKAVMDEIRKLLPNISGVAGLPGAGSHVIPPIDLAELTEQVRQRVSAALPEGIDVPHILDALDPSLWGRR